MLDGKVNPRPNVRCIDESPTTAIYDGDGGMGHFASYHAAQAAVKKAKEMGTRCRNESESLPFRECW